MALPNSPNPISTDQIMTELGIAIQPREWGALWALAKAGSTPKNKANAGGPYVLPNDWWGYSNSLSFNYTVHVGNFACIGGNYGISAFTTQTVYSDTTPIAVNSKLYTDINKTILVSFIYMQMTNEGNKFVDIQAGKVIETWASNAPC